MPIPEEYQDLVRSYCQEPEPDEADLLALNQAWDENVARTALWLGVMLPMVLDEYDQRGAQFEQGKLQDNPVFRRKLVQLKLTEPLPEEAGP